MIFSAFAVWMSALSWLAFEKHGEMRDLAGRIDGLDEKIGTSLDVLTLIESSAWKARLESRVGVLEKDDTLTKEIKPLLNHVAWKATVNGKLERIEEIIEEARGSGSLSAATLHERLSAWSKELRSELTDQQRQLADVREKLAGMKGGVDQVLKIRAA